MRKRKFIAYLLLIFLTGCKERFEPNLPATKQNYLVVEGFINANGPTRIKLSRTAPVDRKNKFAPELNAKIWVEGNVGTNAFVVAQNGNGLYSSGVLPINPANKYRLRIKTMDGKEYLSQFVPIKPSPDIDSVSWKEESGGVRIFVSTHDSENKTRYYKWEYDETWEIHSAFFAQFIFSNNSIRPRGTSDPEMYTCWKYASSNSILIGSSAKLESDIVFLNPFHFISRQQERLGVRYSIVLKQYALEKEGYEFFEQMKKNTESLGTIFDPQPSALRGNVECISNPGEIVIGYVNATTMREKRIFISSRQLTGRGFMMSNSCNTDTILNNPQAIRDKVPAFLPYDAEYFGVSVVKYYLSAPQCVDCRERGGINLKPSYW